MTAIATVSDNIRQATPSAINRSYRYGEAITKGDVLCFDDAEATGLVYKVTLADINRQKPIGIANDSGAIGTRGRVITSGIVVGFTLTPSSEATHRAGKTLYTGNAGTVNDALQAGAWELATIVPVGDGQDFGLMLDIKKSQTPYPLAGVPDADNDIDEGYNVYDLIHDTANDDIYQCTANGDGVAVWLLLSYTA